MRTLASVVLEQVERGAPAEFDAVPPVQWDVYFAEFVGVCPDRRALGIERRPANALNLEIGQPLDRCMLQSPDGRGLAWLLSGGSLLSYGVCARGTCPRGVRYNAKARMVRHG